MATLKTLKGAELQNLVEKWKHEMSNREDNWTQIVGLVGLIRMSWWGYFKPYRLHYFMLQCVDGVATAIAWKNAKEWKKQSITQKMNAVGWAV